MGKPGKKLKKILLIMGITGAVYGAFRYLLPLVIPFLFAWAGAALLRPSAKWLAGRCRIKIGGRYRGVPIGVIGAAEMFVLLLVFGAGIYVAGKRLCSEAALLMDRIPFWVARLDRSLTGLCHQMEDFLCLRPNMLVILMREMLRGMMKAGKDAAMPYLMVNSMSIFQIGLQIAVVSVILVVSAALCLQEGERWRDRCRNSLFSQEFSMVAARLTQVTNAYVKTQGSIMVLTTVICTAGFWLLGNPYYILAGVGVGILDALPVFGTGTVLIPWAAVQLIGRNWRYGGTLLVIYLICYFLREILEARMMGNRVGLSSLETLMAMYAGLQLFGLWGFFLGPVGLLLIEDLVHLAEHGSGWFETPPQPEVQPGELSEERPGVSPPRPETLQEGIDKTEKMP